MVNNFLTPEEKAELRTLMDRVAAATAGRTEALCPNPQAVLALLDEIDALRADFERAVELAHVYGKTASADHVRFQDYQFLDEARRRWARSTTT